MDINYIIASYSGVSTNREKFDDETNIVLQKHMKILYKSLKNTTHIKQITIVIPKVVQKKIYKKYYDLDESINGIENLGIKVVKLYTEISFGSSYSQYFYAYEKFPNFNHYIVMEDDWVPFPNHLNFDKTLLEEYKKINYIGFLSAWSSELLHLPLHSAISVGIISKNSFKKAYDNFNRKRINNLTQMGFSNLFINKDYSNWGKKYMIPFWETTHGIIYEYATNLSSKYLLVPIQLLQLHKYKYMLGDYKIHNNGSPSSDVKEWVKNYKNI